MRINPQVGDLDPTLRKRQTANNKAQETGRSASTGQGQDTSGSQESNATADINASEVSRYVDQLKTMDPVDLHRVETIRAKIEDGSYLNDLQELIDPLIGFLNEPEA